MNFFLPMLAQEAVSGANPSSGLFSMSGEAKTQAMYVGIFAALILSILAWAAFIRKSKKRRKRVTRPHNWELDTTKEKSDRRHRRRERRRRSSDGSSHYPSNPTLADGGGLPPRRPDDVPPPGA